MLIRLGANTGASSPYGILKADEAQVLIDAQRLRAETNARCEETLAQAQAQGEAILAQAHEQATQYMQQAQEQAQQLMQMAQAAIDDAMRRAHEEGQRAAAAEWHERHAQLLAHHAQVMASMHDRLAGVVAAAVERVIAAVPRAALFEHALKHVQALTRGAATLLVRVHPDDLEAASEALARLRGSTALQVEVSADAMLQPGSCIFESEMGVLDAGLGVQLGAMRLALERAVRLSPLQEEASADPQPLAAGDAHDHEHPQYAQEHDEHAHEDHDDADDPEHQHDEDHDEFHDDEFHDEFNDDDEHHEEEAHEP